jgi:formate hydrogenlyase subunit 3/multisubunit Na+/H+ antiporter MnhD subunit
MQGAFLILVQILLVRLPLHDLAQARVALGERPRAGGLSVVVGAVLCGLPPFAGFAARFYLLRASTEVGALLTVPLLLGLLLWMLIGLRMGRALGVPRGRRAIGFSLVLGIALGLGVVPWLVLQTVGLP